MTSHAADVFFSHNANDKELLKPLASRLIDEYDIHCWLDQWELPAGKAWERELTAALENCQSSAVFLGGSGWGPYHLREAQLVIDRAKTQDDFIAIPVLLPGATAQEMAKVGDFFESTHRVDFRRMGLGDETAFQSLRAAIRREPAGPPALTLFTIRRDAQRWSTRPTRDVSALYRGTQLLHAQELVGEGSGTVDPLSLRFLAASAAEERRVIEAERRRNRTVTAVLTALVLALAAAGLAALLAKWDADDQSYVAEAEGGISAIHANVARRQTSEALRQQQQADDNLVEAVFQRGQAEERKLEALANLSLAERRRIETEQQMQRALAFNLAEQGRRTYDEAPLLGARLVVEALQYATDGDPSLTQRALDSLVAMKRRARVMKIGTKLTKPLFIEGTPYYVEGRAGEPSELRRVHDRSLVTVLPDVATRVELEMPDPAGIFRIDYERHVPELRRIADATPLRLNGRLESMRGSEQTDPFFQIQYKDAPSELWNRASLTRFVVLTHQQPFVTLIDGGRLFLVGYQDDGKPCELRRMDSGALVDTLTYGWPQCDLIGVSRDRTLFAMENDDYTDGFVEIRRMSDGQLVPSKTPIRHAVFDSRSDRYIVAYRGGGGEIRRSGSDEVIPLNGLIVDAQFHTGAVVLAYGDRNGEIRTQDGTKVVATLPFHVDRSTETRGVIGLALPDDTNRVYLARSGKLLTIASSFDVSLDPIVDQYVIVDSQLWNVETGERVPGAALDFIGPYVVMKPPNGPNELRNVGNGKVVTWLDELDELDVPRYSDGKTAAPDGGSYVFGSVIIDARTDRFAKLPAHAKNAAYSDDSRFVVVGYEDRSAELRASDGRLIATLSGELVLASNVKFSRDGSVFFIDYDNGPSEVRVSATGEILTKTQKVAFTAGREVLLVAKDSGAVEIRPEGYGGYPVVPVDGLPAALGTDLDASRLLTWYESGEAFLLDLKWHRTGETLAEIERETCRLFEPGLLDQAAVSSYLLGNPPRACVPLTTSAAP